MRIRLQRGKKIGIGIRIATSSHGEQIPGEDTDINSLFSTRNQAEESGLGLGPLICGNLMNEPAGAIRAKFPNLEITFYSTLLEKMGGLPR